MEKLKIAVVGLGNRGQLFAEYVLDSADAELTAIADCNESAREKAQKWHGCFRKRFSII